MEVSLETGLIAPALIILLAAVSGYFSLMETALIECHRGRLEKLSEDGDANAEAVLKMLEAPAPLSVAQIGITFTGIMAGVCAILTSPTIAGLINSSIIPALKRSLNNSGILTPSAGSTFRRQQTLQPLRL